MWKKTANFRAGNWIWQGCNWIDFYNQNCNCGLDWTNHKLRTNVNSDTFLPPFPFNWNDVVSYIVHVKKKTKRCRFERHCGSSSSPGRMKQGKKKIFLPPVFTDFLPLKASKGRRPRTPTCPKLSTCWRKGRRCAPWAVEGRQHSSCPGLSPPCFLPINTGETRRKKKGEERE